MKKAVTTTVRQAIIVLVLGLAVGLAINPVRGKNRINVFRDYFPTQIQDESRETVTGPEKEPDKPDTEPAGAADRASGEEADPDRKPDGKSYPFQEVNLKEAIEIFRHEYATYGLYVFVDARSDDPYRAGHIPGALQCDYYRIEYYFPDVITAAQDAEKIVVYCNGGNCEDSLLVCGELLRADIPKAKILLFKGGWEEWTKAGLPVATGRE